MPERGADELPVMSDVEFRMLCDLLRSHCGLQFGSDSRYRIERRLARRLRDLQLRSFTAYHYLLRNDSGREQELAWVVDTLTTNETYFFRERRQLSTLVEEILPEKTSFSDYEVTHDFHNIGIGELGRAGNLVRGRNHGDFRMVEEASSCEK